MKNIALLLSILFLFSCGSGSEEASSGSESSTTESSRVEPTGFSSIDDLAGSLVQSLQSQDYDSYLTHVISPKIEEELAESISNAEKREDFKKEFGFSLKNEEESFKDMIKYIEEEGISLDDAMVGEMVMLDYEHDHYAPLELKEILIPIPKDNYEIELLFTIVNYNGNWLLTSELGI